MSSISWISCLVIDLDQELRVFTIYIVDTLQEKFVVVKHLLFTECVLIGENFHILFLQFYIVL